GFVQYELKPDFKILGPKYGKKVQIINNLLNKTPAAEVLMAFNKTGYFAMDIEQETINLFPEEISVSIIPREGYVFANAKDLFVALDTKLTDELINEGFAREIVNKIQFTRKEMNLDIMDNIEIKIVVTPEIARAIQAHQDYILSETLAKEITILKNPLPDMQGIDINGHKIYLSITKLNK
ncbi:MAG TPA: DUF5915 domain-containing protein, partial [Candidatus Cloacimonas sp.]|nr:DUF5915 domain-containing protein [Candidatus Cloacimonas sp.]